MRQGRLVAQGAIGDVRAGSRPVAEVETGTPDQAAVVLRGLGLTDVVITESRVRAVPGDVDPERIVAALVGAGVGVRAFSVQSPSLEDLFVALTGEGFDVSR
jgi:ABC-2 type transport system ATP-binding protein